MIKAVILAGGKGTRLRPLTLNTPKPIVPVANIPFLFYQIDLIKRAGITEIILSLSYQPRKIRDIFGDGTRFGMTIRYTVESKPLGTAGAYKKAEHLLDDTTVVFNGDVLSDLDLSKVLKQHFRRQSVATIVLQGVSNPSMYGLVETARDGRVLRFVEKPKDDEITCNTINAGIYILEPRVLDLAPPEQNFSFERELFPLLLEKGEKFNCFISGGYWIDIGTPAKYLQAHFDILAGKLGLPHFDAAENPTRPKIKSDCRVDSKSLIGEGSIIKSAVQIENSVLGRGCFIEEGSIIKNSVLWDGTRVKRNASLDSCIVGKNCLIGEAAVVNKGSVLGDKTTLSDYSRF
ncbi:MAG: NDP-sugar synthase [Acidobacteria bacterium]|nr:NDP-sugar synthase [Acidobacteriota bacterium]